MAKVTYEVDGKKIQVEIPDEKVKDYLEFEESERKAEARERWRQRKKLSSLDAMTTSNIEIADKRSDFEDGLIAREELVSALAELTQGQRLVIELYYFEGYTHAEIAQKLGLHKTSVSQQIKRGLANLKNIMKDF